MQTRARMPRRFRPLTDTLEHLVPVSSLVPGLPATSGSVDVGSHRDDPSGIAAADQTSRSGINLSLRRACPCPPCRRSCLGRPPCPQGVGVCPSRRRPPNSFRHNRLSLT